MAASRCEAWREEIHDGQYLDAKDTAKTWLEAVVIKHTAKKLHIHFRGWDTKYNEWIPRHSARLAPAYTKVDNWRVLSRGDPLQVGTMMEGKPRPVWTNATVTQVRHGSKKKGGVPAQIQVQLDGCGERRWVDAQDDLLCPAATHNPAQVFDGEKTSPVKALKPTSANATKRKRLVTKRRYDGVSDESEEDDDDEDDRKSQPWYKSLETGSLLEVADDNIEHWHEARVICERPDKISVRFRGWPWKYDEWLPRNSKRLASKHTHLGNWRAFKSFGYVQIGFRRGANEDTASHWVLGHVVKKFKDPASGVVGRVEIKWKDDDGHEQTEVRDADDDFLAPQGVPTYPPTQPSDDTSDTSEGRENIKPGGTKTESEDDSEDDEEEELEEEEPFVVEANVEAEEQIETHDGDTTASTVSDAPPDAPVVELVDDSADSAKTSIAERISQLKRKFKEDMVEMYNRAMRTHLALIDALDLSGDTAPVQTDQELQAARPAKRPRRASRAQEDERQRVWKGVAPPSKNTPAHL